MHTVDKLRMFKPSLWKLHRKWIQLRPILQVNCIATMAELASKALQRKGPKKVTFFGTDEFSVQSLSALHSELIKGKSVGALNVVTSRAAKGRTAVEAFSRAAGLPLQHWPVAAIPDTDLGVVVSFGHLLPPDIIEAFPLGVLNVHGSLLPAYRGAAPIIRAVMNGDDVTGVTVMRIHPYRFDVGEILRRARVLLPPHATSGALHEALSVLGARLLVSVVRDLPRHYHLATPQPSTGVSSARKVGEKDAHVAWHGSSAAEVYRQYLGLDDHFPLWTLWRGTTLQLRGAVWRADEEAHSHLEARDLRVEQLDSLEDENDSLIEGRLVASSRDCEDAKPDVSKSKVDEGSNQSSRNLKKKMLSTNINNYLEGEIETKIKPTSELASDKRESVRLKALNLFKSHVPEHLEPGRIFYIKKVNVLWVGCADGVVGFTDIKPKGKKSMNPHDFYNGFLTKVPFDQWQFDKPS